MNSAEFGRPLSVPNDAPFQTSVLLAAFKLLKGSSGPMLEDLPEDAPASEDISAAWACPVNLSAEKANLSSAEQLREAFKREMILLRLWYDLAVKKRGRTTVGVSGLSIDFISDFVSASLGIGIPENPHRDLPLGLMLKLPMDDLKAYYSPLRPSPPRQAKHRQEIKGLPIGSWRDSGGESAPCRQAVLFE